MNVLCLNAGSSSLKFALYDVGDTESRLLAGAVEGVGGDGGRLWLHDRTGATAMERPGRFPDALAAVSAAFDALGPVAPEASGHRLVHGGPDHAAPERIDAPLVASLRQLVPLAPLHLPAQIDCLDAVLERYPALPQVACFDTAFHRRLPDVARRFPLPRRLWDSGIRRYGFHGLSCEYVVTTIGAAALGRAVIAHLGNGASMTAVRNGLPLDTTMGFTPTGGLMMGTRPGDLDPGVLLHLLRHDGYDGAALERLVEHESGLLGVSGISADMRTLLERRTRDPRAADAVELFCHGVRKHVGALAAVLGGLDTLVFTGGIGERAAPVRWETCQGLGHLGIRLDRALNDVHADVISTADSRCIVRVIPTDEDVVIARHTRSVLGR